MFDNSTQRKKFLSQVKQGSSKAFGDKCAIAISRVLHAENRNIKNKLTPDNKYFTDIVDPEYSTDIQEEDDDNGEMFTFRRDFDLGRVKKDLWGK